MSDDFDIDAELLKMDGPSAPGWRERAVAAADRGTNTGTSGDDRGIDGPDQPVPPG